MDFIFTLIANFPFPASPTFAGWFVWTLLLAALLYAVYRWREYQPTWKGREWGLFFVFFILVPLTSLFIGLRLNTGSARPLPGIPSDAPGSALMVLSAVPWLLGGGLLGPIGAAILGLIAGLLRGVWDTYSVYFSVVEFAFMAAWFSTLMHQRYRTTLYKLLRQPLIGAFLLIPLHTLSFIISALFTNWTGEVSMPATAQLDFALSNVGVATLTFAGEMLIGGIIVQIIAVALSNVWGGKKELQPSPSERSLESRFIFAVGAFIIILLLTILVGDWIVAGRAAREMLRDRLSSASESISEGVPFFLETGQNLASQLAADSRLLEANSEELTSIIGNSIKAIPYFDQVAVLDAVDNSMLANYPNTDFDLYLEEKAGLELIPDGVITQIYSIPPFSVGGSARVSFIAAILDSNGQPKRILIGRTNLQTNPLTIPLIESINRISDIKGTGMLLNENGRVLYHSDEAQTLIPYTGQTGLEPIFYDDTAPNGTRQMVYYQPVRGRPWAIVLTVPAQQAQQLALNIAAPLSLIIIILALAALIVLRIALRVVTGSLQNLAAEANRIAEGDLDKPLQVDGFDEVGQLRRAFEQMRSSLRARLEEINGLLKVSQGVGSSLEMEDAVRPVLDAIKSTGARTVRIVLASGVLPDTLVDPPSHFSANPDDDIHADLDDQILDLAQSQKRIILSDLSHTQELVLDKVKPQLKSLLAVALYHENRFYGVIWAGYDKQKIFKDADIRYITTLAGQAALALANANLYVNVEASRRQLEAVLNSTPDPVLVTDHRDRLRLANRAASIALGLKADHSGSSERTENVVKLRPLLTLLQDTTLENKSLEVVLADKRTYLATASSVMVEGRRLGRVCIMRDVTHFKELDTMKSEFVSTVSHDLRSPLTLMRGYATMLEESSELNEQQLFYVKKIVTGVDNMARLVNNLLDLGRIDIGVGLQVENVIVLDIIQRVIGTLQIAASQKKITLSAEFPKEMPNTIEADPELLKQAIYNLVENAIKYTPENGHIVLRAISKPDAIVFAIEDTGYGIPENDIPHLFEKFYRTKQRETRDQTGSGLGLAIVSSIATNHGGRVWVESILGKGSTFYLQVPLTQPKESKSA